MKHNVLDFVRGFPAHVMKSRNHHEAVRSFELGEQEMGITPETGPHCFRHRSTARILLDGFNDTVRRRDHNVRFRTVAAYADQKSSAEVLARRGLDAYHPRVTVRRGCPASLFDC